MLPKSSQTPVLSDGKYGQQLSYDPEFKGPVKSRGCTDILCLFIFIAFLSGWAVVGIFAFREGDPKVLLYPTDTQGNLCGVGLQKDKKFLFFFDLMKCANPKAIVNGCPTPQVCVEKCPTETFLVEPTASDEVKNKLICQDKTDRTQDLTTLLRSNQCAQLYFKSVSILNRCIPEIFYNGTGLKGALKDKDNNVISNDLTAEAVRDATQKLAQFLSLTEIGEKVFADFKTSWKFMILGFIIAMILSLIWIVVMRWLAGPMIWISIVLVLLFLVYGCSISTVKYIELKNQPGSDAEFKLTLNLKSYMALRNTWLTLAISCGVLFALLFLIVFFLRRRIVIAIALIKEASRSVARMMSTLVFPLLTYSFMLMFLVYWGAVALYIASSGKASYVVVDAPPDGNLVNGALCNPAEYVNPVVYTEGMKCMFRTYGLHGNLYTSHAYNLFGLFWCLFFVVGVGQMSLAGAFSTYYWTKNKATSVPWCVIAFGFYRCIRYHAGSVAFGSLLIATMRFIRVVIEYFDKKLRMYDNACTKCLLWCMRCFFWLLEKLLRFISKNAYIMIAIYGKNFCSSAREAFMLLMRNIARVVVIDKITDFLLLMGKLVVVGATGTASHYFFVHHEHHKHIPQLHYNLVPPIVITIGAYIIASGFFNVYSMAVDTLFLCFLEDCERNDGSPERPYFMSKELMKILHKKNKFKDLVPKSTQT